LQSGVEGSRASVLRRLHPRLVAPSLSFFFENVEVQTQFLRHFLFFEVVANEFFALFVVFLDSGLALCCCS